MLSPELLKKVDSLFIKSRRKVTDIFSGEYASAFRGQGIEFEEFREYVPGDDIRQIDWNVTARMDKPFVKVFREEREQTIFFLVDVSASQKFGNKIKKLDVSTEIAALLSYTAIKNQDKVGLILFSDHIEKYIPPKKGRAHVWNLIATLMSFKPQGKKTNISLAVQYFLRVVSRKTTCFLISDFLDLDFEKSLNVAHHKHEFVIMRILDKVENQLPRSALISFSDLEEGNDVHGDFSSQKRVESYKNFQKDFRQKLSHFLKAHNIDFLDLLVQEDYVELLLKFFIQREKRR